MCTPESVKTGVLSSPTPSANEASSNGFCICPRPNGPRSPPRFAELQSLNSVAISSKLRSPATICRRYSASRRHVRLYREKCIRSDKFFPFFPLSVVVAKGQKMPHLNVGPSQNWQKILFLSEMFHPFLAENPINMKKFGKKLEFLVSIILPRKYTVCQKYAVSVGKSELPALSTFYAQ